MNPSKIDLERKREEDEIDERVLQLLETTITATESNTGCVFTCLTCNLGFPSFQALEGHRASHNTNHPTLVPADVASGSVPAELHTCRYCFAQFSTGQALGGHMTKHRSETMKEKTEDKGTSSKRKKEDYIGEERFFRLFGANIPISAETNKNRENMCNKKFTSFQASGGHRARHSSNHPTLAPADVASGSVPAELHTCRYCFAQFSTGQALGGHMTKHRSETMKEMPEDKGTSLKRKREDNIGEERFFRLFGANIPISADTNNNRENMRNKKFTSFQVLGSHRASHSSNNPADLASGSVLVKSHACRFCSARFSTGQALGGHMTKHRSDKTEEKKKFDSSKEGSSSKSDITCEEKSVENKSKSDC